MPAGKGFFITFEGIEGSGKSTAARRSHDYLSSIGRSCVLTREPGGTWLGEKIREILLDTPPGEDISIVAEALLFSASRTVLTSEVIFPALERGIDVISDRYLDSTFAYQGVSGILGDRELDLLGKVATGGILPDLTILLDLPVEEGLSRRRSAGELNRIDRMEIEYHSEVRERFLALAEMNPGRIKVVDSSGKTSETTAEVTRHIRRLIEGEERIQAGGS